MCDKFCSVRRNYVVCSCERYVFAFFLVFHEFSHSGKVVKFVIFSVPCDGIKNRSCLYGHVVEIRSRTPDPFSDKLNFFRNITRDGKTFSRRRSTAIKSTRA